MTDIRLYIGDYPVDLGNAGECVPLWTYTRDEADNPALIRNSYTKTVTLPASPANNAIFSHIGRLDRRAGTGQFTPLARIPFQTFNDRNEIIDRGYAKLEKISRRGPLVVSYDVTFYGGVGSLIYGFTYNADGTKMDLGSLSYPLDRSDHQSARAARDIQLRVDAATVRAAWAGLSAGNIDDTEIGLVNFAPCQNGIPDQNFDAGKAYYKPGAGSLVARYSGIETTFTDDDETVYRTRSDANGGVLIDLGAKVTEWESQDLRSSQQRPVMRVARILEAMTIQENDTGSGWTLALDPDFFTSTNPWFEKSWITLPLTQLDTADTDLAEVASGTPAPADVLVGFAKIMGLVFVPDPVTGVVTLMSRDKFYNNGGAYEDVIDLSGRVDSQNGEDVRPYLMTSRIYDFAQAGSGAFMDDYRDKYGRVYGSFRVDSGFMFDAAAVDVFDGIALRGAADVKESSPWYRVSGLSTTSWSLKWAAYQLAKYQLYNEGPDAIKSKTLQVEFQHATSVQYTAPTMPQFHDKDGKPTDGSGVLLFFNGMQTVSRNVEAIPGYITLRISFHLSDENAAMLALNNGVPCWNISPSVGVTPITEIPSFRRWYIPSGTAARASFDMGVPSLQATTDTEASGVTLYPCRWENYVADRFDVDAMVLRVRVDLSGLPVGPQLLRRFFWYRGSLWSLNRIEDYNPVRPGTTICEFVRVKDVTNYVAGQTLINA